MLISKFITELMSKGKYCFTLAEAEIFLDSSKTAVRQAISRLQVKGEVAMPHKGFFVVVPPEYLSLHCLPAEQFIPPLMEHLNQPYYAGLLSASQYHGAAHHRPQVFQVVTSKRMRSIECGKIRVGFILRKNISNMPIATINTRRGMLKISTPETTAFDLIGYPQHAGGLDNILTILTEMADKLDPQELVKSAMLSPLSWSQRLGYLLEVGGMKEITDGLADFIKSKMVAKIPLAPSQPLNGAELNKRWNLVVNEFVEAEI